MVDCNLFGVLFYGGLLDSVGVYGCLLRSLVVLDGDGCLCVGVPTGRVGCLSC